MVFFNSLPVPEFREWFFLIPFPFPNPQKSFPLTPGVCFFILDYDSMCSETDFTQEKSIFMQLLESPIPPHTAAALRIIICNRLAPILTTKKRAWKMHLWDPSQWDKMCFEYQRIKFQWKKMGQNVHICLRSGPRGWPRPPHTASPTVKYLFFTSSLRTLMLLTKLRIAYLKLVQLLLHRLHLHHHLAHQLLATWVLSSDVIEGPAELLQMPKTNLTFYLHWNDCYCYV